MNYFIAYDIADDRLRKKVSDCLLRHGGHRAQYSVFFVPRFSPQELLRLQTALQKILNAPLAASTDSILCLPIEKDALSQTVWLGDGQKIKKIQEQVSALVL